MIPFELSKTCRVFKEINPQPNHFKALCSPELPQELESIVRLWISEGIPYAFKQCPLLYEVIRDWLSEQLSVDPKQITIVGSGRLGYALKPKTFGTTFGAHSDLDFAAVSESLFQQCRETFSRWIQDFDAGVELPKTPKEKMYWLENRKRVPCNINRGFIDSHKIPNRYNVSTKINDALSKLKKKLRLTDFRPDTSRLSLRVYNDWNSFAKQQALNLRFLLNHI